jgi:hypothetical protein
MQKRLEGLRAPLPGAPSVVLTVGTKNLSASEVVKILRSVSIFAETPEEILNEIVVLFHPLEYYPDQVILHKGEMGDCMYLIVEGYASTMGMDDQRGAGDVFGECHCWTRRMASVAPETTCCAWTRILLRIDGEPQRCGQGDPVLLHTCWYCAISKAPIYSRMAYCFSASSWLLAPNCSKFAGRPDGQPGAALALAFDSLRGDAAASGDAIRGHRHRVLLGALPDL